MDRSTTQTSEQKIEEDHGGYYIHTVSATSFVSPSAFQRQVPAQNKTLGHSSGSGLNTVEVSAMASLLFTSRNPISRFIATVVSILGREQWSITLTAHQLWKHYKIWKESEERKSPLILSEYKAT